MIDSLEIIATYNKLPQNTHEIREIIRKNKSFTADNVITVEKLVNSIKELDNENWDYKKLNQEDSAIFSKLKDQLIVGSIKYSS